MSTTTRLIKFVTMSVASIFLSLATLLSAAPPATGQGVPAPAASEKLWIVGTWDGSHHGVPQDATRFELAQEGDRITWRMKRTGVFSGRQGFVEGSGTAAILSASSVDLEGLISESSFPAIVGWKLRYSLKRSGDGLVGYTIGGGIMLPVSLKKSSSVAEYSTPGPLFVAAKDGNKAELESLLAKGALPYARGPGGETALHWAAAYGHRAIADMLLSKGVDPNAQDGAGSTPLHSAAEEGQTEIVTLLLGKGSSIQATNGNGMVPLHLAAAYGHKATVDALLARGATTDDRDSAGSTPLHLAAAYGRQDIVRLLLGAGANVTRKDSAGNTPLDLARANNHGDVAKLIEPIVTNEIAEGDPR